MGLIRKSGSSTTTIRETVRKQYEVDVDRTSISKSWLKTLRDFSKTAFDPILLDYVQNVSFTHDIRHAINLKK